MPGTYGERLKTIKGGFISTSRRGGSSCLVGARTLPFRQKGFQLADVLFRFQFWADEKPSAPQERIVSIKISGVWLRMRFVPLAQSGCRAKSAAEIVQRPPKPNCLKTPDQCFGYLPASALHVLSGSSCAKNAAKRVHKRNSTVFRNLKA